MHDNFLPFKLYSVQVTDFHLLAYDSLKFIRRFMPYFDWDELVSAVGFVEILSDSELPMVSEDSKYKLMHRYADGLLCKNIKISYDEAHTFNYFWDVWKKVEHEKNNECIICGMEKVLLYCFRPLQFGAFVKFHQLKFVVDMLLGTGCFCHDCLESLTARICS